MIIDPAFSTYRLDTIIQKPDTALKNMKNTQFFDGFWNN